MVYFILFRETVRSKLWIVFTNCCLNNICIETSIRFFIQHFDIRFVYFRWSLNIRRIFRIKIKSSKSYDWSSTYTGNVVKPSNNSHWPNFWRVFINLQIVKLSKRNKSSFRIKKNHLFRVLKTVFMLASKFGRFSSKTLKPEKKFEFLTKKIRLKSWEKKNFPSTENPNRFSSLNFEDTMKSYVLSAKN